MYKGGWSDLFRLLEKGTKSVFKGLAETSQVLDHAMVRASSRLRIATDRINNSIPANVTLNNLES